MANQTIQIGSPYRNFTRDFSATENPLSDSGLWLPNTNTFLTRFKTQGGRAIGLAVGSGAYDDSAALIAQADGPVAGYGADVQLTATVFKGTGLADTTHEMELLFRASQTSTISVQYEALFAFSGTVQFVRWFNNGGSQDFAFITASSGPESLGRQLITGDRIRAKSQGSTFTLQVIEADNTVHTLGVYNDSTIATGLCGIGAFTRADEGGDLSKFNFEDIAFTEI